MCKRREKKMLVTNEMKSGIYRDLIFNILLNKAWREYKKLHTQIDAEAAGEARTHKLHPLSATIKLTGTPISYLRSTPLIMVRKDSFFMQLKKYIPSLIPTFKNEDFQNEALVCLAKCYSRAVHELLAWRSFAAHQRGVWRTHTPKLTTEIKHSCNLSG